MMALHSPKARKEVEECRYCVTLAQTENDFTLKRARLRPLSIADLSAQLGRNSPLCRPDPLSDTVHPSPGMVEIGATLLFLFLCALDQAASDYSDFLSVG